MAVLDYKTLKANIISAGGLGNEYSSSDNDGAGDKFNISGTFEIDLGKLQDKVLALEFSEESDQTFTSNAAVTQAKDSEVAALVGIDQKGQNNYSPKTGGSIFLNSDRVVINARDDFAMLFGKLGVAIASPNKVNIDSGDSITLFGHASVYLGLPNRGESYDDKKTIDKPAAETVGDSTSDELYEPMVLGLKLVNFIEDLITIIESAEIAGPVGNGVFQPSTTKKFELLKVRLPEIISNYAFVDGLSHEAIDEARLQVVKAAIAEDYVPPRVLTGTFSGTGVRDDPKDNANANPVTSPYAKQPGYYITPTSDIYSDSSTL